MLIREFQKKIEDIYLQRDRARGMGGTFMWFIEEVGELATALREGDREEQKAEFADVFAWLVTLASMAGIEMEEAVQKYGRGCPSCNKTPCECRSKE